MDSKQAVSPLLPATASSIFQKLSLLTYDSNLLVPYRTSYVPPKGANRSRLKRRSDSGVRELTSSARGNTRYLDRDLDYYYRTTRPQTVRLTSTSHQEEYQSAVRLPNHLEPAAAGQGIRRSHRPFCRWPANKKQPHLCQITPHL